MHTYVYDLLTEALKCIKMFIEQCSGVFDDHLQQDHRRCSESSPGGLLSGKYQVGSLSEAMKYDNALFWNFNSLNLLHIL